MTGTFDENIHPCKGCEDFIRPNDCKSKGGCAVQAVPIEVLDKIRAEIEENINYNKKMNYQGIVAGLLLTLDIIDKYRVESEVKE